MKTIVASLLVAIATTAFGAELSQKITTPSGIIVHLPSQWQEIPTQVITAQFEEVAKKNPNLPKQKYECGLQAQSQQWFSYPYVLVQIQRTGRIPEIALKKMPNLGEMLDEKMQETADASSSVADVAMGKTVYDPDGRILWTSTRVQYVGIGSVKMLAGIHLTADGFVQVFAYAREADFPRYETMFHRIISRVEFPVSMRYVPRAIDKIPLVHAVDWSKAFSKGIAGAVVGGIAALIFGLTRRKKKDSQPEDSPDSE